MVKENLEKISNELENGNNLGEKITLVAATKFVDIKTVNEAISYGLTDIGENKAQEFRDKYELYAPCKKHFIGHLQSNKVKYLIGKTDLIQSVDSLETASEIAKRSFPLNLTTEVLIEVNIGNELSKSGVSLENAEEFYKKVSEIKNIAVKGLMAMLPESPDEKLLAALCVKMRNEYEKLKKNDGNIDTLSIGMSGDYKIAIKNGSNMVRLGSAIFGKRNYGEK